MKDVPILKAIIIIVKMNFLTIILGAQRINKHLDERSNDFARGDDRSSPMDFAKRTRVLKWRRASTP